MVIEIIQSGDTKENEPTIKEKIEIEGIDPFRITPVNTKIGSPISMAELLKIISEIDAIEQLQQEALDNYYARKVPVYEDGNLSSKQLDLPHHIGLRVVLESVLQKYGKSDNLQIQIS